MQRHMLGRGISCSWKGRTSSERGVRGPRNGDGGLRSPPSRSCVLSPRRSEEHTSELQSLTNLVCRLLLEKKNAIPHWIYLTAIRRHAEFLRQLVIWVAGVC